MNAMFQFCLMHYNTNLTPSARSHSSRSLANNTVIASLYLFLEFYDTVFLTCLYLFNLINN